MSNTNPRLAVAQPKMQWSGDENTSTMLSCISIASSAGAKAIVFPELAITGFHRKIASQAKPNLIHSWLNSLQEACARQSIAATFGAPSFGVNGEIFNSQIFVDANGALIGTIEKNGLTPAEATFFAQGTQRPTLTFSGVRSTAVICREIEDVELVAAQLETSKPSIIFWPGLMSPEDGMEHIDPPRHVEQAKGLAKRTGAYVIQSNWPNALNYPERSAETGRSAVISPSGTLLFRLPKATAGVAIFSLLDSSFTWHPQADA